MYKILKSMLAEFSYFIEKHFGITSILWSILFMAGCCAIVGVVIMKTAEIISCCKSTKKAKKSGSKSGGKNGITDSDEAASVVSADNTGNNECGKCKNGLSMFPVYVGFTVVCSYMMNRLIALSYTWDSKLQRVMSNFHYVLSFKANRKLFLNALSLPDNTTNNNGLFQIAMYLNNNQWQKVLEGQCKFLEYEFSSSAVWTNSGVNGFLQCSSAYNAGRYFLKYFERPAAKYEAQREASLNQDIATIESML